jgi:hypothetical protein
MEFKLYDNRNYRKAKDEAPAALQDISLVDTVKGMLQLMINKDIVKTRFLEAKEVN